MSDEERQGRGRVYAGATAPERRAERRARLLEAGLELLGRGGEEARPVTVRGVCAQAELIPRYFYESFDDLDDLVAAVFESVIAGAAAEVASALAEAPTEVEARARTTVEAFVAYAIDDPRRARVLFVEGAANPALRRQRGAALRTFAELAAAQGREIYGIPPGSERLAENTAYMVAGGMAELLLAWVHGELASGREELVEDAVALLGGIGEAGARIAAQRRQRDLDAG